MEVRFIFPTGRPIRPEGRQIGRGTVIDGLYRQVVTLRQHTLLIAPRRTGKTSLAWGVLDRVRSTGEGWVLEVNLTQGPVGDSSTLARQLAEQARAAGVRLDTRGQKVAARLRALAAIADRPIVRPLATLLGLGEIAELAAGVDQTLATGEDEDSELRPVLAALVAAAVATDRLLVIFIDEVQRLCTDWSDGQESMRVQQALAEVMEGDASPLVVLLAGSDRAGLTQLMAEGGPLHYAGMSFEVPPIDDADWRHALPLRFAEAGIVSISPAYVDQILEATDGHPERTMQVCVHLVQLADPEGIPISEPLVAIAIENAQRHPSWPPPS